MSVRVEPGREVDALLPGRKTYKRVRVHRITPDGLIVVVHPVHGGLVGIREDRVRTVHYKQKMRKP